MDESRDMSASVQYESLMVGFNAEGVSWNPDIADDLQARVLRMFREALKEIVEYGLISPNAPVFNDGSGEDDDSTNSGALGG